MNGLIVVSGLLCNILKLMYLYVYFFSDYGEIDVEARLASLPQYSPAQFKPQGKSQHHKKSTFLYKNSTFVKKEGKTSHKHNSKGKHCALILMELCLRNVNRLLCHIFLRNC